MDPLGQREAAPPEEEAAVASIRAATKDLQQSVQELCKANLEKISSARQCLHFSNMAEFE